jgi:hypothetical protein
MQNTKASELVLILQKGNKKVKTEVRSLKTEENLGNKFFEIKGNEKLLIWISGFFYV